MKRNIILPVIAIFLLIVLVFADAIAGAIVFLALLLAYFLLRFLLSRKKDVVEETEGQSFSSLEEIVSNYGEPDDTIVLDASRANELSSLILFYKATDTAIIAGKVIRISEITGVAPKNFALPYTVDEWGVVINTRNKACRDIHLRVGYDGGLASDIANQIYANLQAS